MSAKQNTEELLDVQITFTIPFTQVQNSVIDSLAFDNPIDKMVYISLLRFASQKGRAYPSISILATMNSSSENRIRQSLKRLEEMELITIRRRKLGQLNISNLYELHDIPHQLKEKTVGMIEGEYHG